MYRKKTNTVPTEILKLRRIVRRRRILNAVFGVWAFLRAFLSDATTQQQQQQNNIRTTKQRQRQQQRRKGGTWEVIQQLESPL